MITFTDKGAEKVQEFLDSQSADIQTSGLRVGVRGGGCSGFQYALAFDTQRDGDEVFEDHGLRILVDGPSLPYVRGAVVVRDLGLVFVQCRREAGGGERRELRVGALRRTPVVIAMMVRLSIRRVAGHPLSREGVDERINESDTDTAIGHRTEAPFHGRASVPRATPITPAARSRRALDHVGGRSRRHRFRA